ncbi:MAG: sialate O-acetylesterase [bacterium]
MRFPAIVMCVPIALVAAASLVAASAPPAASAGAQPAPTSAAKPVLRVYLLAGQSNMEGHGVVDLNDERDYNGGRGTLARFVDDPANKAAWGDLRAAEGAPNTNGWTIRDDVFVSYLTERGTQKAGALTVGYSCYDDAHHFGPELGIGRQLGQRFDEPVLLVKTAWGGKSLMKDFRPPSAEGDTGPYYTKMLEEYRAAIAAIPARFPQFAGHAPHLDGFIWFQGWNDACDRAATAEYAVNLTHLIADVRAEFGQPTLPFVVGETGNWDGEEFRTAQRKGCEDPSVAAHARFVPTRGFLRKPDDSPNKGHGHHWFGNGESYMRVGDALGAAMVLLVDEREKQGTSAPAAAAAAPPKTPAKK